MSAMPKPSLVQFELDALVATRKQAVDDIRQKLARAEVLLQEAQHAADSARWGVASGSGGFGVKTVTVLEEHEVFVTLLEGGIPAFWEIREGRPVMLSYAVTAAGREQKPADPSPSATESVPDQPGSTGTGNQPNRTQEEK